MEQPGAQGGTPVKIARIFLDRFVERLESEFRCQDGPPLVLGPIFEPYAAIRTDLEEDPVLAATDWYRAVRIYASGRGDKLYWRVRPALESETFLPVDDDVDAEELCSLLGKQPSMMNRRVRLWRVYSRLLVGA